MERYEALEIILEQASETDLILSTTGMTTRELSAIQDRPGNFYMLGSMGLLSSLGLGLAIEVPGSSVFILEGDGSALMNLGILPLVGSEAPRNLTHIVLDNGAYESTGGQPTISSSASIADIARTAGYPVVHAVEDRASLTHALTTSRVQDGPRMILIKIEASHRDVPRVAMLPTEITQRFREHVQKQTNAIG